MFGTILPMEEQIKNKTQMKKTPGIVVIILLSAIVLYNSVYFEKLDLKIRQETKKNFNPKEAAVFFWKNKLNEILKTAIDLKSFDSLLVANSQFLIKQFGKTVGISSNYSFLVKGVTNTAKRGAEEIPVVLTNGNTKYILRLKYIFGNSVRDAVGYFKVDDFNNTMDFNAVATELNSLVLKEVIADKFDALPPGTAVKIIGAIEISTGNTYKQINITPLQLEIIR
jgi:predicted lipoprotein